MARSALRPSERAGGPDPRRRGRNPGSALDRAAAQRRDHFRVHAVLRRQCRARGRSGYDDGRRSGRDLFDAAAPVVPGQSLPGRRRLAPAQSPWSAQSGSSTRRRRPSAGGSRSRATIKGTRVAPELIRSALVADSTAQLPLVDEGRTRSRPSQPRASPATPLGPRTRVQPRCLDLRSPRRPRCSPPVQQRRAPWPSSEPRREVLRRLRAGSGSRQPSHPAKDR